MTPEGAFLISMGQALATMSLYADGHPARAKALDSSFDQLLRLMGDHASVGYSFLGGEAVVGSRVMTELGHWDWASKLAAARIERIEIDADVNRDAYRDFLEELATQLTGRCVDTALRRQMVRPPMRFGQVSVRDPGNVGDAGPGGIGEGSPSEGAGAAGTAGEGQSGVAVTLTEEIAAVRWIHAEVSQSRPIPMAEVEAVVHSLAAAMHQQEQMLVPLLMLKEYDQYTTTHACNVSVLAMGLAERLGLSPAEVRAIGVAGLLHDIGKVAIPHELLVKPGRYTDEERAVIQRHPVEGARMILERERGLGLAAVVAYEHHIYLNGGGYPVLRFPRACHYASRIVHICDIYDALCTDRPYRQAWVPDQAMAYLDEQAGRELDPDLVRVFRAMIEEALVTRLPVAPAEPAPEGPSGELPATDHLCNEPEGASVLPNRG
ncbi:MAG: HD domain-containing protein [Gemmatimonadetes bacterium]|nr:HD domain-containing protein [Gemmatimonadota bacterium]